MQVQLSAAMAVAMSEESVEDELMDLLSCHRSASWKKVGSASLHVLSCPGNTVNSNKEDVEPYAWRHSLGAGQTVEHHPTHLAAVVRAGGTNANVVPSHSSVLTTTQYECVDQNGVDFQARLQDLQSQASTVSSISFSLPKANALAGAVLQHSINLLERTFAKHDPMIFKVGYTHNPMWRWSNSLYGYRHAVEKWSSMIVFYASSEPFSPAMLESALIEKYQGTLAALYIYDVLYSTDGISETDDDNIVFQCCQTYSPSLARATQY